MASTWRRVVLRDRDVILGHVDPVLLENTLSFSFI
jgi:hypothetical protein